MVTLPQPRGETSERVLDALARDPGSVSDNVDPNSADPLADDDLQLALYCCYELHYGGLPGVDERWDGIRGCSDNAPGSSTSSSGR